MTALQQVVLKPQQCAIACTRRLYSPRLHGIAFLNTNTLGGETRPGRRPWRSDPKRFDSVVTAASVAGSETVAVELKRIELSLPADVVAQEVKFDVRPLKKGQAIYVEDVSPGTTAYEAGIRPGQRLLAISDAVRTEQMWALEDRPSLKFVRMTLQMLRRNPVQIVVETAPGVVKGSSAPRTIGEQLEEQLKSESKGVSDVQKRMQRRRDYMAEVSQRNDSNLAVILFSAFLLPAITILTIAYFSGYLDTLYSNTMYLR